jgi:hypothetical protein
MGLTTPRVSCFSKRTSGADGVLSPPGFLLPVKKQVVDPNDPFRVVGSCLQLKQTGGVHVLRGIDLPLHAGVV